MTELESDRAPADVEIGSTRGRTHAEVLEQTLGFERNLALPRDGPPMARGSVIRSKRTQNEEAH